jgi:hypothetical protein
MKKYGGIRRLLHWLMALSKFWPQPAFLSLPLYFRDWLHFVRMKGRAALSDSLPCLMDRTSTTAFDPHYFFQAAWLARKLATARPEQHVDIGSDIRILNVLSAFVPVDFLDYRPLKVNLVGLSCEADNLLGLSRADRTVGSLSCLHVIEHVGLGRYGDPIDPDGTRKAAMELNRVLAPSGRLYISLPVGRERVCFNAHRVFDPDTVLGLFSGLQLDSFSFVDDAGEYQEAANPQDAKGSEYACGMYVFSKPS